MDKFKEKQLSQCDIMGMRCHCCNSFHGKDKVKLNRLARARLKEWDRRNEGKMNEDGK